MTQPATESARRLRVATSLLLFAGAITAAAVINGCAPAQTEPSATPTPTSSATAAPQPTAGPTASPTPAVIVPDGSYGPGVFTRGADCPQPFFVPSYSGTLVISGTGTAGAITESQTRNSTGTYNATTRESSLGGGGLVGSQQATWTLNVIYGQNTANATETIRLANGCTVIFVSTTMQKR